MLKALTPILTPAVLCGSLVLAQQQTPPAPSPAPQPQAAPAQQQTPCSAPEFRQLDFWVGEWDLEGRQRTAPDKDEWQTGKHKNTITKTLDGCVIQENFDDLAGFKGMSVSTYDARAGKWKQTWVDNSGSYIDLVGEYKDGKMVFVRQTTNPQGKLIHQRMVFSNIKPDSLDWDWESSPDGQTWRTNWKLRYTRKK